MVAAVVYCRSAEIHDAVENGNLRKVKVLLESDPKPLGATNEWGSTALHEAAYRFRPEMMAFILGQKLNVEAVDSLGLKALHLALSRQEASAVEMLLKAGATVDARAVRSAAQKGD